MKKSLLAVPVVLALGVWALATIHLQTELLPLFPQDLPSVRGVTLFQSVFGSAQEVAVVFTGDGAESSATRLRALPDVKAVSVTGARDFTALVRQVAWVVANLPPTEFAEFQQLFEAQRVAKRLEEVRGELAGAVDGEAVAMLHLDPLGVMAWLRERAEIPEQIAVENRSHIVLVQAKKELRTFKECQKFMMEVREACTGEFLITGRAAFVAETSQRMERDMWVMFGVAVVLVSVVFWLFYRSLAALGWVLAVQLLAGLTALLAGRVLFGELNVISIGFSAILLGVGMDYCILVYHHAASGAGEWSVLRRGIWLSAVTTAAAFGVLWFSSFPGLRQLAALVGVGLLATAFFATELLPALLRQPVAPIWLMTASDRLAALVTGNRRRIVWAVIVGLAVMIGAWHGQQLFDGDVRQLRPTNSEAARGLEVLMKAREKSVGRDVIVTARNFEELRKRVPVRALLLPQEEFLVANRAVWRGARVETVMEAAGFGKEWSAGTVALANTLDEWNFGEAPEFMRTAAKLPSGEVAAVVRSGEGLPASWEALTADLARVARADARRLCLWVVMAVALLCAWAHRSVALVMLNGTGLLLSLAGLVALLMVTRQSLTVLSLLAIPLLVGLVIDISLHLVLGLEKSGGDIQQTFRQIAVPVVLTGLCSMIGFGAPLITAQPALRNFGLVMDLGILSAVSVGLVVLPVLYSPPRRHYSQTLYQARWFDAGLWVAQRLRRSGARALGKVLGLVYYLTHARMRATVRGNLDLIGAAAARVRRVFVNYGATLADYFLLGEAARSWTEARGTEYVRAAMAEGRGVILVTGHLGLFEMGGLWMEQSVVVTLPEPSPALSAWRARYRARWGAETIEIGDGQLSSVEIVRHLKRGACVALLADRPYDGKMVSVNGVPVASAPVWLSLLSGSPIIVTIVVATTGGRYRLETHAPLRPQWLAAGRDETIEHYTREMGQILSKTICEYPEQWYQFAPLS